MTALEIVATMTQLTPHAFQVLLALSDADRHGNGIVRHVLKLTDDAVRLWPVTLYRTLDDLTDRELVVEISGTGEHPVGASHRRRYYRLTEAGAEALAAEAERLDGLASVARSNLRAREQR